jgi:hypothetical protein
MSTETGAAEAGGISANSLQIISSQISRVCDGYQH